jgi:uncharacterized membrane protein
MTQSDGTPAEVGGFGEQSAQSWTFWDEKNTSRLESLSDGVFGVAITLLGFNLQVPDLGANPSASALLEELGRLWPSYLAFVISFFTILANWAHHTIIFRLVDRANLRFVLANTFVLLLTTALPFTTSVVAEYLYDNPAAPVAVAFYAGSWLLVNVSFNMLWFSASHHGGELLRPDVPETYRRRLTWLHLTGLPCYLVATAVARFSAYAGLGICALLWAFWMYTARQRDLHPGG